MPKKRKPKSELEKFRARQRQVLRRTAGETLRRKYYSGSVDATLRRLTRSKRRR